MVRASRNGALARRHVRGVVYFLLIAGSYYGPAKLGMSLSVSHGVITPVWAPSGIALAALLVLGVRFWPAVAVGAFLANATSGTSLAVAAGIAAGNTLAAVVGALLVQLIGFTIGLDRVRSVLALVVGGAVASTAVAATNGVLVLTLADAREDSFGTAWLLWWFGDAIGVLVVAPFLLVLYEAAHHPLLPPRRLLEGAVLTASLAATCAVVFLAGAWRYPYLIFPFLFWAALRFRQTGAAVATFVVGALATWGAVDGSVPLGGDSATERVQLAQASFAVVAVSLLVLGATLAEREADRHALALTAQRLGDAQAIAHIGSWEWNIRSDEVAWSDELFRIYGFDPTAAPLTHATYLDHVHPEDRLRATEDVWNARKSRRPFSFEHRIIRTDGQERVVASRGRILPYGGEPGTMVGTVQDVTEQRQVERLREDILSAVSHELRTPLTSVLGFALTLEKHRADLTPETIDETIAALADAARRLDRLLVDLLDVERLRRGLVVLEREHVNLCELVARVVAECNVAGRDVEISCEPVTAEIDRAKLERIVENLVVNADKHTPPGGTIEVRLTRSKLDVLIVVADDGPGIPDEYKEVVFETFNRGPNVLAMTPGAGIGLSLVARFAAVHGGRSWVEDAPGGGSAFHVLLPGCVCDARHPVDVA